MIYWHGIFLKFKFKLNNGCCITNRQKNSVGIPGKNMRKLLGRPIMEYPLMAASNCKLIDHIYISTDSKEIAEIGKKFNIRHIERPHSLAMPETLTEDVLVHALDHIRNDLGTDPELICLMFCNVVTTSSILLTKAITILKEDRSKIYDSVFSVSEFNMFAPMRARKISATGLIKPYVEMEYFKGGVSSIRDDNEDCYFADFGIQVCRPSCFDKIESGIPPVKWMGQNSYAIKTDYGFDIDKEWQFPAIEFWLKKHGFKNKKNENKR